MRVAILSESSADEAALRILAETVLGVATTSPEIAPLRSRGWPAIRNILPVIAKQLHFHTDAEGLIVVADSNHATVAQADPKNRLIELKGIVSTLRSALKPLPARAPLKIAVGVASPAIEAWLLCHQHSDISEAAWEKGLAARRDPYTKLELKKRLYGVDKPPVPLETERMIRAATELRDSLLLLTERFPNGFGNLAQELRAWRSF